LIQAVLSANFFDCFFGNFSAGIKNNPRTDNGRHRQIQSQRKIQRQKDWFYKLKGDALQHFIYFCKLGMNVTNLAKEFSVLRCTIYRWKKTLQEKKLLP